MSKLIQVTNRSNGFVGYALPERRLRREFNPHETKSINYDELVEVAAQNGGRELLYNYLLIQDKEAMRTILNVNEDPEYWLTESQLPAWMNSCSLNEFKDALDFAPDGIKELIKSYAVSMPLNDVNKREAILNMLGFNVTSAIALQEESEQTEETAQVGGNKRRTEATTINSLNSDNSKYTIINKIE